jgi:hypothetical protein
MQYFRKIILHTAPLSMRHSFLLFPWWVHITANIVIKTTTAFSLQSQMLYTALREVCNAIYKLNSATERWSPFQILTDFRTP